MLRSPLLETTKKSLGLVWWLLVLIGINKYFFYLINQTSFSLNQYADIFSIIEGCLYYDFIIVFIIWSFFWMGMLAGRVVKSKPLMHTTMKAFLTIFLIVYTLLNLTGALFYKYNFELPSNRTISIMWENRDFSGAYLKTYFVYVTATIIFIAAASYLTFKYYHLTVKAIEWNGKAVKGLALSFVILATIAYCCITERKGPGLISPNSSFRFVESKYRDLVVNPLFNLGYSFIKGINTGDVFIDLLENKLPSVADRLHNGYAANNSAYLNFQGKNFFIIVIESGSAENFASSSPGKFELPFFDSLKRHSLYFNNAYANAYLSADGIKAIFTGLGNHISDLRSKHPYIKDRPLIGEILAKKQYHTSFFYSYDGADYWKTLGFSGIRKYYDQSLVEDSTTVHPAFAEGDQLFFQQAAVKMKHFQEPFLSGIANKDTHNPYDQFAGYTEYRKKSPAFSQAASLRYFDDVLKNFFNTIRNYSWFNNTVFLFVADHYSRADDLQNQSNWGLLQIPMMIFDPGGKLQGTVDYPVQQTDIPTTVINLLGYEDPNQFSNANMLDSTVTDRCILTRKGDLLLYANDSLFMSYDMIKQEINGIWNYRKDPHLKVKINTDSSLQNSFYAYLHKIKMQYRMVSQ